MKKFFALLMMILVIASPSYAAKKLTPKQEAQRIKREREERERLMKTRHKNQIKREKEAQKERKHELSKAGKNHEEARRIKEIS